MSDASVDGTADSDDGTADSDDDTADSDDDTDGPSREESSAEDSLVEVVHASGHEHVTAAHASTFELTTDDWLTPAGDCILGVEADRTPSDFDPAFRAACRDETATIEATLTAETDDGERLTETITGRGDPGLALSDGRSMVGRTSEYTDDERTILVGADGAAADLDREFVAALADGAELTLRLSVGSSE